MKPRTPKEIAHILRNHAEMSVPLDPKACARIADELDPQPKADHPRRSKPEEP